MKKTILLFYTLISVLLISCQSKEEKKQTADYVLPQVSEDSKTITFKDDKNFSSFQTEKIEPKSSSTTLKVPAKIAANVSAMESGSSERIILFEDQDLSQNYTEFIQHKIKASQLENVSIKQKEKELKRLKDLKEYGSSTGKEILEAETDLAAEQSELANEKAGLLENQVQLRAGGFIAEDLQEAKPGTAYLISEIPENQIGNIIEEGAKSAVVFNAFPNDTISGQIKGITDRVDSSTRMMKVRIQIDNDNNRYKTGMYAHALFDIEQSDFLSVNQHALITIQGKHYVFIKKPDNTFKRRQIFAGPLMGDRIIVYDGLEEGEEVAVSGVMQLKGLSFGY